jgi:hypothetical protein
MRARLTIPIVIAAALMLAIAAPVAAKDFGPLYINGEEYRTFGNPANVPPGTGTDPIAAFTTQGGVAQFAPGEGAHGGRWQVWVATWAPDADIHLVTSWTEVLALEAAGELTLVRNPDADFRCPILPARGNGHS